MVGNGATIGSGRNGQSLPAYSNGLTSVSNQNGPNIASIESVLERPTVNRRYYPSRQSLLYRNKVVTCTILVTAWILTVFIPFLVILLTQKYWPILIFALFNVLKPILYFFSRGVTVRQSFGSVRFGSVHQKTSVRFGFFSFFL